MKSPFNLSVIMTWLHGSIFVLFLYSAVNKTLKFDGFVNELDKSIFFGNLNTTLMAAVIVALEYVIPALLFFNSSSKLGYMLSFFLLAIFTIYIVLLFKFSPYLPCSCGGLIESLSWSQHLLFNLIFMAISGFLIFKDSSTKSAS